MPTFCRHNRMIQNCPICSREQSIELRPVVSRSDTATGQPRSASPTAPARRAPRASQPSSARTSGLRVRRLARGEDDGYRSTLAPGLKSSADAHRLAEELAFAAGRLAALEEKPPGAYAEVADPGGDIEERTWLAFMTAYLSPLEGPDPFSSVRAVRTIWASGELPALEGVQTGPRTAHQPGRGARTLEAYRAWAQRAGSQAAAFTGEASWTAARRFARAFERLTLPGLHRDARFELLVTLGTLGLYELEAGALHLGGDDQVTVAAKRALGIGDALLLERRAAALAEGCGLPLEALDVGLYNWEQGRRATLGLGEVADVVDPRSLASARDGLGI